MATINSACILLLILGSLVGTCMAEKALTTRRWSWGWGWSWGSSGGGGGVGGSSGGGESGGGEGWGGGGWPTAPAPAAYNFSHGGDWPFSHRNRTHSRRPNKIVVGGSYNWNFGFNYTDWALKNGPYYLNDKLVFKYPAPVNGTPGHSVYLLPDFWSYLNCDLSRAKRIATTTQGGGKGFEFKLTKWQPHYFACGEHNGIHCNLGMMKFFVMPIFRY